MRLLQCLIAMVVLVLAGLMGLVYSGMYDVAASSPHTALGGWLLHTTMRQSVEPRAADIDVPGLDGRAREGFVGYRDMCVGCHGAPGVERSPAGKGLRPRPPDLGERARTWSDAELFWIIKHGVRMTGMPAWGVTHSDREIWDVVAFVRQLPGMSAEAYRSLEQELEAVPHRHGARPADSERQSGDHGHDHEHP